MNTVFENRYVSTYKQLVEFYRKHGTGPRIPTVVTAVIFFGWITLYSYINGISDEMQNMLLTMGAVYAALFFLPHLMAWGSLYGSKKQNDGVRPETTVTFGEDIQMYESMVHLTIEYRKIVRVVRLKHSYLLMTSRRTGVLLDPNGFTKGTFEEFKQFLRQKRPDLTIPE